MSKYEKWYYNIIKNARKRILEDYSELHHIIPKSLGGTDDSNNLVHLTAREHFICHILLTKFTKGQDRNKMLHAVMIMKSSNAHQNRYINGRLYESIKKEYSIHFSENQKGENNSFYGKKHSFETRQKMSDSKRKLHNSDWINPHKGMKRTEETKRKISLSKKGKPSSKKGIPQGPKTQEQKENHRKAIQGKCFWWNNGTINMRGKLPPGPDWTRGRILSESLYKKFCLKK